MKPLAHILASIITGLIFYVWWHSLPVSIGIILGGIFIDLDHFIDYFSVKRSFNLMDFLTSGTYTQFRQFTLLFHSLDLWAIILIPMYFWLPAAKFWLAGLAIGFILHLLIDLVFNHPPTPFYYFLLCRLLRAKAIERWEAEIRAKKDGLCQDCGQNRPLALHYSGPLFNLYPKTSQYQALCLQCHRQKHQNPYWGLR